jgi:DNA modification methylase
MSDHQIEITNIVVEESRIRRHFDPAAIRELADSIAARGLIHAPVIRITDGAHTLIAGERRFRAINTLYSEGRTFNYNGQPIPLGILPFTTIADLPLSEVYAIELEENIIRRDISWQERIAAQKRLHELRVSENPEHTIADTAAIIYGGTPTPVETHQTRVNVLLADHLHDPDVSRAKDEREATQIARRKMEALLTSELAARTTIDASAHTLLQGNCIDLLPVLTPGSIDCMITDPPYGIDADTFTKQGGAIDSIDHHYDDSFSNASDIVHAIATAACMKPDSHIWMFCDIRKFNAWVAEFEFAGWYVWPQPIIWDKGGVGSLMGAANGPRHTYEAILFAQRGSRRIGKVFPDVLRVRTESDKLHAAQKPVELYQQLLELSCIAGETVLDPCCGSGTIFPAATAAKLIAIGMELDPTQHANAKLRVGA